MSNTFPILITPILIWADIVAKVELPNHLLDRDAFSERNSKMETAEKKGTIIVRTHCFSVDEITQHKSKSSPN